MLKNVKDWERIASVATGAGLSVLAARTKGANRVAAGTAAAWLLSRGLSGYCLVNQALGREREDRDDTRAALGGSRGVSVRECVTIQVPPALLFDFWRDLDNLPLVMPFLERVDRLDGTRSHWVVQGPAGSRVEWDAEIINEIPDELIAWKSLPGADVASAGSVHFKPAGPRGTRVTVVLQYEPVGGRVGASLAALFGRSPGIEIRKALQELKRTMESGGQSSRPSPAYRTRETSNTQIPRP